MSRSFVLALLSDGTRHCHPWNYEDPYTLMPEGIIPSDNYDGDWMRYCVDLRRELYPHVDVSFRLVEV